MKMKTGGPDGLEAWCVALSACFINFVMAGLGRMSGILYVAFIDIFRVDRKQASVPFSARSLTRNLLGPVAGIIGQKYSVRVSSVAGGIIGTLSTICCFYGNSILWITIVWGVIGGLGAAMTTTLNQVLLGQYFVKYRTTASGMSFSGGCVGSFLFPALLEYLLHKYGLNGTYLILAGIIMNVIPAAMLLRKPSWTKTRFKKTLELSASRHVPAGKLLGDPCHHVHENAAYEDTERDVGDRTVNFSISTEFLRQNNRLVTLLLTTHFADRHGDDKGYSCLPRSNLMKELEELYNVVDIALGKVRPAQTDGKSSKFVRDTQKVLSVAERKEILRKLRIHTKLETKEIILLLFKKLLREDVKNITALFPEDEHRSISKTIEQIRQIYSLFMECETYYELLPTPRSIPKDIDDKLASVSTPVQPSNTFAAHIKTAFRIQSNPMFLLISLSKSIHFLTFVPAVTIIVDFSMDKGLLEEEGKYIIAALSVGDLIGRLCLGWVTDKKYITLPRYMFAVMVLQGACTASLSLPHAKVALYFNVGMFGLLQGSLFVRHPVLVSNYLGSNEQSVAMGCFNFYSGLLGFVLPVYIGYFRDTVGSYDDIFYINGTCGAFVGVLWLFEPVLARYGDRNRECESNCTA